MAHFQNWLNPRKGQVEKLVDTTSHQLRQRNGLLQRYFRTRNYDDWRFLWLKVKAAPQIASVVSLGGEIPKMKRNFSITELAAEFAKLGLQIVWDEEAQKQLSELQDMAQVRPNLRNSIAQMIYGDLQGLVRGVEDLSQLLTWKVVFTGQTDYKDPRTKAKAELTYDTVAGLFPAALATTARWTEPTTANGLQNLVDLNEAFYAENGFFSDATVMSRKGLNFLLAQDSTKKAAVSRQLGNPGAATDFVVRRQLLNELVLDRDIPPITLFDERYTDHNDAEQRFTPENSVAFLTRRGTQPQAQQSTEGGDTNTDGFMGEIAFGPVVSNNNRPGIYSFTEEKSKEPPIDTATAVASVVPAVFDPRMLSAQQVFDAA